MKRCKKLTEMAYIDTVKGMKIEVYTDRDPPHFHVTKKDEWSKPRYNQPNRIMFWNFLNLLIGQTQEDKCVRNRWKGK